LTLFVYVIYMSADSNFISTNCRAFILNKYCYDLTAPDNMLWYILDLKTNGKNNVKRIFFVLGIKYILQTDISAHILILEKNFQIRLQQWLRPRDGNFEYVL